MRFLRNFYIPKLGIATLWLALVVLMDVVMFLRMGWAVQITFLFSFFTLFIFALLISCIPNRIVQICIFTFAFIFQVIVYLANFAAHFNLNEIFLLQNLYAFMEIFTVANSGVLLIGVDVLFLLACATIFLAFSIFITIHYRDSSYFNQVPAGYNLKSLIAVGIASIIGISTPLVMALTLPRTPEDIIDRQTSSRFLIKTFSNKQNYLRTFGSAFFYTRNLLEMLHIQSTSLTAQGAVEYGDSNYVDPTEWELKHLDSDYNLIMLMMESVELSAIDPILTPNLWEIMNMSTSINGYYSIERTCMTEYVSLTGSHIQGLEMWSNFPNVTVPQSLANIFRRAGYDQMGAFHDYSKSFYGRKNFFKPDRNGFDFIHDINDFQTDHKIRFMINENSDKVMFDTMINEIAPENKSFLSYVLNVSTHANQFSGTQTTRVKNQYDENGWCKVETLPDFQESLDFIMDDANYEYLAGIYPKIHATFGGDKYQDVRVATLAYLVSVHEYDRGVGVLLNRLKTTPDLKRDPSGNTMLIDTTALVCYSDHYLYPTYNNVVANPGGSLTAGIVPETGMLDWQNKVTGEKLAFFVYNPREQFDDILDENGKIITRTIHGLPNGRVVDRFMANVDIYPTICHIFNIKTNNRITLGVSAFDPTSTSLGCGFLQNVFFTDKFKTRDFREFEIDCYRQGLNWRAIYGTPTYTPDDLSKIRARAIEILNAMSELRKFYLSNTLYTTVAVEYAM